MRRRFSPPAGPARSPPPHFLRFHFLDFTPGPAQLVEPACEVLLLQSGVLLPVLPGLARLVPNRPGRRPRRSGRSSAAGCRPTRPPDAGGPFVVLRLQVGLPQHEQAGGRQGTDAAADSSRSQSPPARGPDSSANRPARKMRSSASCGSASRTRCMTVTACSKSPRSHRTIASPHHASAARGFSWTLFSHHATALFELPKANWSCPPTVRACGSRETPRPGCPRSVCLPRSLARPRPPRRAGRRFGRRCRRPSRVRERWRSSAGVGSTGRVSRSTTTTPTPTASTATRSTASASGGLLRSGTTSPPAASRGDFDRDRRATFRSLPFGNSRHTAEFSRIQSAFEVQEGMALLGTPSSVLAQHPASSLLGVPSSATPPKTR